MTVESDPIHNRVALVEDHVRLASLIIRGLAVAGIAVDHYATLEAADHGLIERQYAAVILDRGMPDGDGIDLVRRLRDAGQQTPCLMLTARDALHDRVDGLDAGADDYLVKPFALEELSARVRALMRRTPQVRQTRPTFGDLVVDPQRSAVTRDGEMVSLSASELQIVIALVRANGRTVRRDSLEMAAWGITESVTPNALDVAVHRVRKKIAALGSGVTLVNMRSLGFLLAYDSAA